MVYIRQFSTDGSEMLLLNTLQGHELEITSVRWNQVYEKWMTSSEDGTIKIWVYNKSRVLALHLLIPYKNPSVHV